MGEGCQVQVYTWALLTQGAGSRYSGSTGVSSPSQRATFLQMTTSASAGLARNDFPTLAEVLHAAPLSFSNKGEVFLEGTNLGRRL